MLVDMLFSTECMDEGIRAALFDDVEEGEFEELDDDFVLQVMDEPTAPDFDFEAHCARLLAKRLEFVNDI